MKDALHQVLDALPDTGDWIRHLYENDDQFRSLCRDYADASKAIQNWRQSIKTCAPDRIIEYQSLNNVT